MQSAMKSVVQDPQVWQVYPRHTNLWRIALLAIAVLLSFPPESLPASFPLRIAAIFSRTGIAASHNEPLVVMTELAVREINAAGGLLGRTVELIELDNQSTAIGSTMAAREAVEMDVLAVIGAHWSSHSLAMAPILQAAGIPMISPGSTNPAVTLVGDYIFRVCFLDSFQGRAMARFAYDDLRARSVVIMRNIDEAYSITLADFFQESFSQNGGTILADLEYRGNAIDFTKNIVEIRRLAPDIVYLPGYTRDSGLLIKQAKAMGLHTVYLGGDAWDEIGEYAGDALDGSYQSAPWHPEVPYKRSMDLQALYRKEFGKPIANLSAPLAYDAVQLLAGAIRKSGSTDRIKIRDALASTRDFQGATGSIAFDRNGDPEGKKVIVLKFEKGKSIFFKTIAP